MPALTSSNHRKIFWSLFLAVFAAMMGVSVITPFLPLLGQKFGATATELGILVSAFSVSRIAGMPLAGKLSDRFGRRRFILAGLTGYALLSFGYLASHTLEGFTFMRLLHGLAASFVVPLAIATVADMAPQGSEGTQIGNFSVSVGAGWGLGPMIGGFLLDHYGFDATFYFMGLLTAIALGLAVAFLPKQEIPHTHRLPSGYRKMLRDRQIAALTIYRITSVTGRSLLTAFLPLYAVTRLGLTPTQTGVILSVMVLLMSSLQPVFGRLSDRFSRRRLLKASAVLSAAVLSAIPFTGDFWQLLAAVIVFGAVNELGSVSGTAMVVVEGRRFGMGSAIALSSTALSAGMIVGPLVGGLGEDHMGPGASFWIAAGIAATGIVTASFVNDNQERAGGVIISEES